jgi:eukaryotic-like serine/threonine-protein kinase
VVAASVPATVGAVLGHVGLAQIGRTGERGRDRALVGVTLSYAFVTAAVIALVVWAALRPNTVGRHTPPSSPAVATATTTTPAPPPPAVAAADLASLLPDLQQVKDITNNPDLTAGPTTREMSTDGLTVDRQECYAALGSGSPPAYDRQAVRGFYEAEFLNTTNPADAMVIGTDVSSFEDAGAARLQVDSLLSQWRQCAAATAVLHYSDGRTYTAEFTSPSDAGDGITTMEARLRGVHEVTVRAVVAKANIVVDVLLATLDTDADHTLALTKFILGKIPG